MPNYPPGSTQRDKSIRALKGNIHHQFEGVGRFFQNILEEPAVSRHKAHNAAPKSPMCGNVRNGQGSVAKKDYNPLSKQICQRNFFNGSKERQTAEWGRFSQNTPGEPVGRSHLGLPCITSEEGVGDTS